MNRRLNTEEAVQYVLSPGSDSELSDLSDFSDTEDDEVIQFQRKQTADKETDG